MSLITAAACNSALEPQVLEISQSINSLRGTHFERLPEVILKYNTVHDSIEADEPQKIAALKASVLEHVSDGDTMYVAATVVMYNPQDAAGLIMRHCIDVAKSEASLFEKRARISDIVAITRFVYAKSGEPSSIGEWETAIDNAVAGLPAQEQALLYTSISTPAILGKMLSAHDDPTAAGKIADEVRKIYADTPDLLEQFNNHYNCNNKKP